MKVGAYELLEPLGQGGMGSVSRGRAPDGREVAVKLLARQNAPAAARFERERRLLASFGEDEGFVPLLDAGSSEGSAFLVMPLLRGGTLRGRVAHGPLGVGETLELGRALATALGHAHAKGVVHRDVKPENVLFTAANRPLLADLGLAKHFDRGASGASQSVSLSREGMLLGTAGYMAPEQMGDAKSVGPAADVFSLAAVLYECLTGEPAFAAESSIAVLARVQAGRFEPLRTRRPDADGWLVAVIERGLAREGSERFPDARAFLVALRGPTRRRPVALLLAVLFAALAGGMLLAFARRGPARAGGQPALEDAPAAARALVASARARLKAGDNARALADLGRAVELDPRSAEAHAWRGTVRLMAADDAGGLADGEKAVALDARLAAAWSVRGAARCHRGDVAGGIADLTRAIELDPTFAEAWMDRGVASVEKGDLDGAIEDQTRALELDAKDARPWKNRGLARMGRGDFQGAAADATQAIELDPRLARAWSLRGEARENLGDPEGAIADENRALELDAKDANTWAFRAHARATTGDPAGGIADADRAIELDPRLAYAWATRGGVRLDQNDPPGAIADATRAIELQPELNMPWLIRAEAHEKSGELDAAIADYERFLALSPVPGAQIDGIRRRLAGLRARR